VLYHQIIQKSVSLLSQIIITFNHTPDLLKTIPIFLSHGFLNVLHRIIHIEKAQNKTVKRNPAQILKAKIDSKDFSFNHQYEAFRTEVKRRFDVGMPFLATQFRRMRVKVLHEGYNPEPEEKDSLVSFTTGLLRKLEDICSKTEHIKNKQKEVKETTNENLEKLRKDVEELKEEKDRRVSG
jgi:hypothetical protein